MTLFGTGQYDIIWDGPQHFLQDHMSANQWLGSVCANAQSQSHCFELISQTSKLSLDERWAHMQSCRKCCASAGISEILLAGFIFISSWLRPAQSNDFFCIVKGVEYA